MKEPVLVILAAGMGSRYGGLKQIDTVGSNGESIIDFSIYDAIRAGFKKVALIIRREHEEAFRKSLTDKIEKKIEVEFVFQDLYDVPEGITVPEGREKPWGTTHALLACRNQIDAPFMICNADDYYGPDAFKKMYDFLKNEVQDDEYGMVGYMLENTLTDNGTVTRGVCESENGCLSAITEIQKIRKGETGAEFEMDGKWIGCENGTLASMNFWGFTPKIFAECEEIFTSFIGEAVKENPMKCEHVIPTAVGDLVKAKKAKIRIMASTDRWFGVTYKEDKPSVVANLQAYKDQGLYPFDLWK
ncbi:MAG: nucleotidyltransferase [Erysipelotrichaceae bacterium]|nr:nucleotidyltransferase [Erysipelotrichaceae bacterium]